MIIGLGIGIPFIRNYISSIFDPSKLFTGNTNGVWYDPSDMTTLYQDAAGTTPVTAVGQPVGLMLDKSKGLVLGPELVTNGTFDANINGWSVFGDTASTIRWDAGRLEINAVTTFDGALQTISGLTVGKFYEILVSFVLGTATGVQARLSPAPVAQSSGTSGVIRQIVQATSTSQQLQVATTAVTGTAFFDNISVRELPGNHAFNPSGNSANFPVLQQDGTGRYYLSFNGVNQWLQTNSIDFSYGDKMFVSAGVRKLSDAAASVPFELSVNGDANTGTFQVNAPSSPGGNNIVWFSYGTTKVSAVASGLTSPVSSVMSGIGSISGPESTIRINGVQITKSTSSQGTGNYGNYPLYIGARAGSSLWFNGRLYGLVVAGKAASTGEITNCERYLNQKTGAY